MSTWRPRRLDQFIGQEKLIKLLIDEADASRVDNRPLPHMVLFGPPGLGKTALIHALANYRGVGLKMALGSTVHAVSLSELLAMLNADGYDERGFLVEPAKACNDILCIDEAEVMPTKLFEMLHKVLEPDSPDGRIILDVKLAGRSRPATIWIAACSIIFITNYLGKLKKRGMAAVNRCGIKWPFQLYSESELTEIILQAASSMGQHITPAASELIARRAMGVPRTALNLLNRTFTRLQARLFRGEIEDGCVTGAIVEEAFELMNIDDLGLDQAARDYLTAIGTSPTGKLGLSTIAAKLGLDIDTITVEIEPFLHNRGLINIEPGGRTLTNLALHHLGLPTANPILEHQLHHS